MCRRKAYSWHGSSSSTIGEWTLLEASPQSFPENVFSSCAEKNSKRYSIFDLINSVAL